MDDVAWFFCDVSGKERGPVSLGELKNQLKQGITSSTCLAWRDPASKKPISELPELKLVPMANPPPSRSLSSRAKSPGPLPAPASPAQGPMSPKAAKLTTSQTMKPLTNMGKFAPLPTGEVNAFDGSVPMPPSGVVVRMFDEYLAEKEFLDYTRDACINKLADREKWQVCVLHQSDEHMSFKNPLSLKEGLLYRADMADSKKTQTLCYCTIRPGLFQYYKDQNDNKAVGEIVLCSDVQVSQDPTTLRPADPSFVFTFVVSFLEKKKAKKFVFSAESEQGEAWILMMNLGIAADPEKDKPLSVDNVCFEMTADMMMGIRTTVGRQGGQQLPPIASEKEFTEIVSIQFPRQGSSQTPPHKLRDFGFKDYCPSIFRRIRARYGLDPASYQMDVCGNFNYLEFVSNSKSGEFFFHSHCRKYMIKTISHAECRCLFGNMPTYYRHVMSQPNTVLNKFFGLHKVKPSDQACNWFLVMGSVFPTQLKIHRLFDLKGSTHGRRVKPSARGKDGTVYKDLDFVEQKVVIDVGSQSKDRLLAQIRKDVEFLENLKIIDYSVLMGMHYPGGYDPRHCYKDGESLDTVDQDTGTGDHASAYPVLCEKCGAEEVPDARFCPSCGQKQSAAREREGGETLEKEGGRLLKRSKKIREWRNRWFMVQKDGLTYFPNQAAAKANANPKTILFKDILCLQIPSRRKGESACRLRFEMSGQHIDLQAPSKDLCDDWVALLVKRGIEKNDKLPVSPSQHQTFTCECGVRYEGFFCTNCGLPRPTGVQPEPLSLDGKKPSDEPVPPLPKSAPPGTPKRPETKAEFASALNMSLSAARGKPPARKPPAQAAPVQSKVSEWRAALKELAPTLAAALEGLADTDLLGLSENAFVEKAAGNLLAKAVFKNLHSFAASEITASNLRQKRITVTCRNDLIADLPPVQLKPAVVKPTDIAQSEFAQHKGGIKGFDEEGVEVIYYIGIIDTLIEYNLKKKMERGYKANIKGLDPAAFSVVEPPHYAQRLLTFITPKIK